MLYGRLEPGGLINVVTKRPLSEPYYSVQQQFGSFHAYPVRAQRYYRLVVTPYPSTTHRGLGRQPDRHGSFDTYRTTLGATGPIIQDGTLSYRLDFEYLDSDSFRDFAFNDTRFVSPKLTWRIGERTQIDFEYFHFDQDTFIDFGIPVIGNRPANIPIERSLQEPGFESSNTINAGGVTIRHSLTDRWQVQGRFFRYNNDARYFDIGNPGSLDEQTGLLTRSLEDVPAVYDSIFGTIDLTGHLSTWALSHTLLIGADYYDSTIESDGVFLEQGADPINIFAPQYGMGVGNTKLVSKEIGGMEGSPQASRFLI